MNISYFVPSIYNIIEDITLFIADLGLFYQVLHTKIDRKQSNLLKKYYQEFDSLREYHFYQPLYKSFNTIFYHS